MKPIKIEVPLNEENEENSIDIDMPEVEIEKEDIEIDFQNHTVNQKLIPWPKGDDGLTPTDEQLIALIEPRIPKLKQPKDWKTPTRTEIKEIIKEVLPEDKLIEKIVKKVPRIKGDKWDKGDTLRFADLTAYEKQILTWPQGSNGVGVPRGGTINQILAKSSSRDFDTEWIDNSGWGGAVDSVNWQTWVVVLDQDDIGDGTTYKQYSQTEKTKLAGIETGAEVNTIDTVSDTTEIDLAITARDLTATLKNGSIDESKLDTSVNTSLDLADTAVQPAALSSYQLLSEKDQTNGYAGLDWSGKINSAQIPDIALSQFLGNFTDTTAALANAWVQASQIGDWFTVDTSGGQSWIVTTSLPTTLSDITQLKTPTGAVTSVFSRTGTVTAQNGDYTASQITNVAAGTISATDVQTALNELDTEKGGLAVANTWTAAQSISTNTSGQQIFLGTTSGWYGYWIGRNTSTGFLDFVGTQGSPFDGIQCAVLRASSSITINGENVIRNWSSTLWLGSGSGTPWAILQVRWWTQDFMIGGGSGTSYVFQRNSGTGFMEITGQQSGYTGYIFNTANGTNAHTINDSGNNGFGVAIGSILAKVHVWGTLLAQKLVEANTAGSGSPNVITSTESGSLYTNEWATALNYHTLPTAVAWLTYTFYVDDADWVRVTANTGDIIQINGVASASAGYAECTAIGGCLTLTAINATDWVATSVVWSWTLT